MRSITWTADALGSEARPWTGRAWRLAEVQHLVSTTKLTDSLEEQRILEDVVEAVKPPVQSDCRHLHRLLRAPFRYEADPTGSRFRSAGRTRGVFQGSEHVETAVAETARHRMRVFRESPGLEPPQNAAMFTAVEVALVAPAAIDLTEAPLVAQASLWEHPGDHGPCQALAKVARQAGIGVILSRSVHDPKGRKNVNVLAPSVFAESEPTDQQTWQLHATADEAFAIRDVPRQMLRIAA